MQQLSVTLLLPMQLIAKNSTVTILYITICQYKDHITAQFIHHMDYSNYVRHRVTS